MAKILVVEDDGLLGEEVEAVLVENGYEVVWKQDGKSAWEVLNQDKFDLVLLDVMLPEMNGREVLKRIRAEEKLSQLPVVMFSNLADKKGQELMIQEGATDYLVKSGMELDKLVELVKTKYLAS